MQTFSHSRDFFFLYDGKMNKKEKKEEKFQQENKSSIECHVKS